MANLNRVLLIGRLTRDPELKHTQAGTPVCNASLAINRRIPGRDGGEGRQEVCFVEFTAWGKTGENLAEYMSKGREIFLEGRLQLDQWDDPNGNRRSKLKVIAEQIQFLGKKGDQPQEEPLSEEEDAPTEGGEVPF